MEANTESLRSAAFDESTENGLKYLTPKDTGLPPFRLVLVKGGAFLMGDDNSQYDREKPAHKVNLNSFYMAEFQVSQELYQAVTGENPSRFKNVKKPVEQVSWFQAIDFCNALSKKIGFEQVYIKKGNEQVEWPPGNKPGFRLPTEAEWEYAARGGKNTSPSRGRPGGGRFEFAGSNKLEQVGWYGENSWGQSKKSGLKFPNAAGLYDMSGNLFEWCWDWYSDNYYEKCKLEKIEDNPRGPETGERRVLRGGSWDRGAFSSRVLSRFHYDPHFDWIGNGFRLVLGL